MNKHDSNEIKSILWEFRMNLVVRHCRIVVTALSIFLCAGAIGCTPSEETEIVTDLQGGLNSLLQNRSLTEQFVRDVKAAVTPSDPQYAQVMDSYQNARDVYDRYLDDIEEPQRGKSTRSLRSAEPIDVQNATADFLADATGVLRPNVNTRRIPFQRAIVIPETLPVALRKVPKKAREKLIDRFDSQLRWRSWSEL